MTATRQIAFADYPAIVLLIGQGKAPSVDTRLLREDPQSLWKSIGHLREWALTSELTALHRLIADFAAAHTARSEAHSVTVVTCDGDGRYQRAGCSQVIELHGSLLHSRCTNARCELSIFKDDELHLEEVPDCPFCGATVRPDYLLADETVSGGVEWHVRRALRTCQLFMACGFPGNSAPAQAYATMARKVDARTVLLAEALVQDDTRWTDEREGPPEELLQALLQSVTADDR